MKLNLKNLFFLSCMAYTFIVGVATLTGCNSTPATAAYKTEGVIITSVDTGMRIWADQVNTGHATQKQVDTVKQAYNAYYDAQMLAKAALEKYIASTTKDANDVATANAAVGQAEAALLSVLNQFILTK